MLVQQQEVQQLMDQRGHNMKHFFALMDFKKAFKDAQAYHIHAIQNGSPETKAAHLAHHHRSGNYDLLAQKQKSSPATSSKGKT